MARLRQLVVVADDFGIGSETSRGILEAAAAERITGTVLLVNAPYAAEAVSAWNREGRPVDIGWHPNLTLDQPILPAQRVSSLIDSEGNFHKLGRFLRNSMLGRMKAVEVHAELRAQYKRFIELVGHPPAFVNSHQHVSVFRPVRSALHELLREVPSRPFVRRVREPMATLTRVPGARLKRLVLSHHGRRQARALERDGFPGCDWLAGITDPHCVANPAFFRRWLGSIPGQSVELMCHPGHRDRNLIGRDCLAEDHSLTRRVREFELLMHDDFLKAASQAGFELVRPNRIGIRTSLTLAAA